MSTYETGADDVGRFLTVATPSTIKQEIDSVDQYVRRLNRDVQTHRDKMRDLLDDWHLFAEEWTTFRSGAGWWARTSGATLDKALDYRKRADAWDELVRRRGATTTPARTGPTPVAQADMVGPLMKLAAFGIAAYVGVNLVQAWKAPGGAR
jgi:hypothetical protein